MAVAGIDVGSQSTKVVILESDRIVAAVTLETGESGASEARQAMGDALLQAGLKLEDLEGVVATGIGRGSVRFAQTKRSVQGCLARGARFLFPQARTVLDCGAESSTAVRLSADGAVEGSAGDNKCAAASGVFLETVSHILRIPLAQLGPESLKATRPQPLASTCAIFAESELVSLVHRDPPVPVADILAGVNEYMVEGLFGTALRAGLRPDVVMCGGVSRNTGIVRAMETKVGSPVLVPGEPQIVGALGAALAAQQGWT
jgi:predicted CoA-substrate-specific enzyme activase